MINTTYLKCRNYTDAEFANQNDDFVSFSHSHRHVHSRYITIGCTVKPPNIIAWAHEKGFKFQAQPHTGAYSCFRLNVNVSQNPLINAT